MIKHEDIAKKAEEIWEREGKPKGKDQEIWLRAESMLYDQQSRRHARQTRLMWVRMGNVYGK